MNAVLYAMQDVVDNIEPKTITGTRQYRRGCFVLAGYLHQGIALVSAIKGRYLTFPEFQDLRAVALDAETRRVRGYVKKVRNYAAFHLDEYDETTRRTLSQLKPTMYILTSGDDPSIGALYYDLADEVDITFLLRECSTGGPELKTPADLFEAIFGLAKVFLESCQDFNVALAAKIKLNEHIYRT